MDFPEARKHTPLQAKVKIKNWCAYQERSQQEVRDKLYSFGLHSKDVEAIIADLISANFISEERFACAFARGKFRIKKWGRIKIKNELKAHRVSDYCIRKAMMEIDEKEYLRTLEDIIKKKDLLLKEKQPIKRNYKLLKYASSKGFEQNLIIDILKEGRE